MESHIKLLALARSPTKIKHECQLGYADILVLFYFL